MRLKACRLLLASLGLWLGSLAEWVWADELPLRILLANDPAADYADDRPAVVLFQNFVAGDNGETAIRNWVTATFGGEFSYVRDAKSLVPGGVISRFGIVKYGVWSTLETKEGDGRSLYAQIDLPGKKDLWVVNTHLSIDPKQRLAQTNALLDRILTEIPETDYLVVGGQLNITDADDPALEVLQKMLGVESPLLVKQEDGEVYDWLLIDADLAQYQDAEPLRNKAVAQDLNLVDLRRNLYRLIKNYRLDLSGFFQPPPPITLENAVMVDGSVSPVLARNIDEYRFTPTFPALESLHIEMESAGPGDADLQLAYWSNSSNGWVFYANRATPGTSDESITITDRNLLNREWRIIVQYSAGSVVPYRLRAFAVYDLWNLHNLLHPSPRSAPPGAVTSAPRQNAQPGGWQFYALDVPANAAGLQIEVERTGGGPAHLYVQKDAPPWFNNALFQIQNNDIIHTLSIDGTSNPPLTAGRWYVGIQAPGPQDADFNLTATLSCCAGSPPVTGDIPLANGVPVTGSVWFGDWQYYIFDVPLNATRMEYTLVGNGPGDGDLYIDGNQRPTLLSPINSRQRGSTQEQIIRSGGSWSPLSNPSPRQTYIGVYGYRAAAYEVTATWSDLVTTQTLPSGDRIFSMQNIYVYDTSPLLFAIQVPAGTSYNDLRIAAQTPDDIVLYLRRDAPPDKLNFDFSAVTGPNDPEIVVTGATNPSLAAGTWWFAVYSNERRSDITDIRAELHR